ncbi:MAG: PQQ-binding-like beta-propeller repeat protein [Proteobacteria bacterium]|nr:PQQ-binding-like beta-propeller repeat protein [Pseudomonadota bacterium]
MRPLRPIALVAAAVALSACSTVQRVGHLFDGGNATPHNAVPQEGRVSILASDQALVADPALASRTIAVPAATDLPNWSQPGGNETNSPPNAGGSATLQQAWRANLGGGTNGHVALSSVPVIAQGRLFFLDANQRVTAVDASNGHRTWSVALHPQHSRDHFAQGGGLAVSEGRVYVTTGYGFVVALDASNGHEVWRADGSTPYQSSPTVAGGRVYAITNDSTLIAMDASTGEVQWNFQAIAEPARIVASPSVAVAGETVIAPFASGELSAVVSANGRRLWGDSLSRPGALTSLSAINDIPGRPVVTGGVVYAASHSGVLVAINLNTGQRVWAKPFASTQTPCVIGDVVYAVSVDGELAAFDRATGGVFWVKQLRRYRNEEQHKGRVAWVGPIMVGGRLVLANSEGEVVGVTPENGEVVAHGQTGHAVFIPPVTANGMIYLVTDNAQLVVLR